MLYNIHLYKACQYFIPVWGGGYPSQINSLGSIQVIWQLYSTCQPIETILCFCICLIAHTYNTIDYVHIIQLKSGRSMVVGHVLRVRTCSFMCTNPIEMIAHTTAFLWVGEHSHHPDFDHESREESIHQFISNQADHILGYVLPSHATPINGNPPIHSKHRYFMYLNILLVYHDFGK